MYYNIRYVYVKITVDNILPTYQLCYYSTLTVYNATEIVAKSVEVRQSKG